jgi:hypothetical protein
LYGWTIQEIGEVGLVIQEVSDQGTAVIPQPGGVVEEPFGVEADAMHSFHLH